MEINLNFFLFKKNTYPINLHLQARQTCRRDPGSKNRFFIFFVILEEHPQEIEKGNSLAIFEHCIEFLVGKIP